MCLITLLIYVYFLFFQIKGNVLYQTMEVKLFKKTRSYHSLRNALLRYILPNIVGYTNDKVAIAQFERYGSK